MSDDFDNFLRFIGMTKEEYAINDWLCTLMCPEPEDLEEDDDWTDED